MVTILQEELKITKILEFLIQVNSVCKILDTLEDINSQRNFVLEYIRISTNNPHARHCKQIKCDTNPIHDLVDYWLN